MDVAAPLIRRRFRFSEHEYACSRGTAVQLESLTTIGIMDLII
jgi:hypothetical protein